MKLVTEIYRILDLTHDDGTAILSLPKIAAEIAEVVETHRETTPMTPTNTDQPETSFVVRLVRAPDPGFTPISAPPLRVMDDGGRYWRAVPVFADQPEAAPAQTLAEKIRALEEPDVADDAHYEDGHADGWAACREAAARLAEQRAAQAAPDIFDALVESASRHFTSPTINHRKEPLTEAELEAVYESDREIFSDRIGNGETVAAPADAPAPGGEERLREIAEQAQKATPDWITGRIPFGRDDILWLLAQLTAARADAARARRELEEERERRSNERR